MVSPAKQHQWNLNNIIGIQLNTERTSSSSLSYQRICCLNVQDRERDRQVAPGSVWLFRKNNPEIRKLNMKCNKQGLCEFYINFFYKLLRNITDQYVLSEVQHILVFKIYICF